MLMEARSSRTWATIPSAAKTSATWFIMFAVGTLLSSCFVKARMPDEYAFALGALSHYTADIDGHPAVNEAVALRYPKLRAKYGNSVRYAQDTTAHLKTEFGFDTLQVAKNRYASDQYHDFIGFKVAQAAAGADLSRRLRAGT